MGVCSIGDDADLEPQAHGAQFGDQQHHESHDTETSKPMPDTEHIKPLAGDKELTNIIMEKGCLPARQLLG